MGIVYRLEVLGLRPALRARFIAHWDQVYDFLESRHGGGAVVVAIDLGPTIEEMVQDELIEVEIDQFLPDDERVRVYTEVFQHVQEEVIRKFFEPTLGTQPLPEGGNDLTGIVGKVLGALSFKSSFRTADRHELKRMEYDLSVSVVETRTLTPQGTLSRLLRSEDGASLEVDSLVSELVPSASLQMDFDLGSAVDLEAAGIDRIELVLGYGDRSESVTLTGEQPSVRWSAWYDEAVGAALSYSYEVHWTGDGDEGLLQARSELLQTTSRVLRLQPALLVQEVGVRPFLQGVPSERFPRVLVDLRLTGGSSSDGPEITTLELHAEAQSGLWSRRLLRESAYILERRIRFVRTDGTELVDEWLAIEPGPLVIADPEPDVLDVEVLGSARFGTEVARLVVELCRSAEPEAISVLTLDAENAADIVANEGRVIRNILS